MSKKKDEKIQNQVEQMFTEWCNKNKVVDFTFDHYDKDVKTAYFWVSDDSEAEKEWARKKLDLQLTLRCLNKKIIVNRLLKYAGTTHDYEKNMEDILQ